jgi:tetraacyldisaccharide 4'-kinase
VISVGNLTVGGTGKTPVVEWVARWYRQQGKRVAILSRGYGSADGPNDEALVLEENLPDVPHLQGKDRAELARIAVDELEAEILVLDDGFQHRRLARNLDLVLIDALAPFGSGQLFPGGTFREPLSSLARAGLILITRSRSVSADRLAALRGEVARRAGKVPIATVDFPATGLLRGGGEAEPIETIRGKKIGAFCGIGHPEAFARTLADLGAQVVDLRPFPDHHPYRAEDIRDLEGWARRLGADGVVTTQKDSVKIRLAELGNQPLWAVRIEAVVTDGRDLCDDLLRDVGSTLS